MNSENSDSLFRKILYSINSGDNGVLPFLVLPHCIHMYVYENVINLYNNLLTFFCIIFYCFDLSDIKYMFGSGAGSNEIHVSKCVVF